MTFPRYPDYKDSGVEWLGEVPEHWEISPLKRWIRMRYGDALSNDIREEGEIEVFGSNGTVGLHSVANTKAPAIIVGRKGSYGKIVWAENGGFVIDTAYSIDSDTTSSNLRWVYYALQPLGLDSLSQDTGVPGLAREKAYGVQIVVPPFSEQCSISTFLDRETAKIDALIAEQQRLIELLKEKRQAVISHAVTKGLNPDAPMKDSGIEWLGEVPVNWNLKRVKHITRSIEQGWSPQCESYPVETQEEWGVLKVGCVNGGFFKSSENKALPAHLDPLPELGISKNDLIISRANTRELVGSAAVSEHDFPNLLLCDKLYRIRLKGEICSPTFLCLYLGASKVRGQIELQATGASSSMLNIGQSTILELEIALPSIEEQFAITTFLDRETAKLDTLTAEAQRGIELFKERRTALISAAVTGKIDVRGLIQYA
jgi:type I restriction enzyme S subunit